MYYLALMLGMLFLGLLYLSYQWEEDQYEKIDDIMDDDTGEVTQGNSDKSKLGELWSGEIRNTEVRIEKGWQNEIYVKIEHPLSVVARIEYANPLRKITRFFQELFTTRFAVNIPDKPNEIIAYSEEKEPVQTLLRQWNHSELTEIIQSMHHVELRKEGFTVQFYQPDFNLNQLTDRAKAALKLYESIPEKLKSPDAFSSSELTTKTEHDRPV